MEIINDFGINFYSLIAQIVNFLLLLFILNKILFKPLLKVLDERKRKIAVSLEEAEQISKELANAEKTSKELIEKANLKSDQLILEAREASERIHATAVSKAKLEAEKIFQKNQENLTLEKEKMRASLRAELMDVVVIATQKILGKNLSVEEKRLITKSSLKEI